LRAVGILKSHGNSVVEGTEIAARKNKGSIFVNEIRITGGGNIFGKLVAPAPFPQGLDFLYFVFFAVTIYLAVRKQGIVITAFTKPVSKVAVFLIAIDINRNGAGFRISIDYFERIF